MCTGVFKNCKVGDEFECIKDGLDYSTGTIYKAFKVSRSYVSIIDDVGDEHDLGVNDSRKFKKVNVYFIKF